MNKKFIVILIVNFILLAIIFLFTELFCMISVFKVKKLNFDSIKPYIQIATEAYTSNSYVYEKDFRPVSIPKQFSGKLPLLVMGCSYAYGLFLEPNETPASQLSEATGRVVYNLGIIGSSPREMLYILSNDDIRNKYLNNETNFEYVFYPYISHHLSRLYANIKINPLSPNYKVKNGELVYYEKNHILQKLFIFRKFYEFKYIDTFEKYVEKFNELKQKDKFLEEAFDLQLLYMKEINKEIKKHFPFAKFVILIHEDTLNQDWSELEKEGIIVLKSYEIANIDTLSPEYTTSETDVHPNAKAWSVIIPKLVDFLHL